jgi:hypothetical protein
VTPEGEHRLRSFVRAIVEGASIPRTDADDLIDEMLGHLVERVETLTAEGATEDDAIRTATAEFGDVGAIGVELGRTYHSRLWASTVGALLAAREVPANRPRVVGALRLLLALQAILAALLGASALLAETPVRAVVAVAASAMFIVAAALALRAIGTGHAWALTFGVGVAAVTVLLGVAGVSNAPPGTTTIPVGAIAAAGLLMWVAVSGDELRPFVATSPPIGRRRGSALAAALLVPTVIGTAWPGLPDPTQATAADVEMTLSMACGRRDLQLPDGPLLLDRPFADLTVDMFWRRADLLPGGISGLTGGARGGDTAGFRITEPPPIEFDGGGAMPTWMLDVPAPKVVVVETGEVAGWFGATSPSVALIPDTMGSFTVGVETDRIRTNRTIHIGWSLGPTQDATQLWPRAEVAYAHLDRFVLIGDVTCGERTKGTADRQPGPPQPRFLP